MDGPEMVIHFLLFGFMAYKLKMAFTLLNYVDKNATEIKCSLGTLKCLPSDPPEKLAIPCPRGGAMRKAGCAGRRTGRSSMPLGFHTSALGTQQKPDGMWGELRGHTRGGHRAGPRK